MQSPLPDHDVQPGNGVTRPSMTTPTPYQESSNESQRPQTGSSMTLFFALIMGIGCGLFFGPWCEPLSVLGTAFVGLLQMTVLPYISVSLLVSLGRMSWSQSRRLAGIGGLVLFGLWAIALAVVAIMPMTFPEWSSGSFFSTTLDQPTKSVDLMDYFIPSNLVKAFAENHVPGIILFCILGGIALAKAPNRHALLDQLDVLSEVLLQVTRFVSRLTPIGIFAIAASTAGTVSFADVTRMQAYLLTSTVAAVFVGLIVLPLLITTLTPLSYRQIIRITKDPLLTTLATGKLIIVLPMLVENTKRVLTEVFPDVEADTNASSSSNAVDINKGRASQGPTSGVMIATAYPFPTVGKLLTLMFIPFAAWFVGSPLRPEAYPAFLSSGLFAFFGGPILAIPFLLDQMRLPHDLFELFLLLGVIEGRLSDAVGVMHLTALTLLSTYGFRNSLRWAWKPILQSLIVVGLSGFVTLACVRLTLLRAISAADIRTDVIVQRQLLASPVPHTVSRIPSPNPTPRAAGETILERVRRRGVLRVGFNEDKVPFAFFNDEQKLVGYDVNMAHAFAKDLGVTLEFVHFDRPTLLEQLNDDHFDIVMSGLVGTMQRAELIEHTSSYLDVNLALVVPDYRSHEFRNLRQVREMENLRIGYVDLSRGFRDRLQPLLPNAKLIEIKNNGDYFRDRSLGLNGLLISAESGSTFTLMYPSYEVVIPEPLSVQVPLFYAIADRDSDMKDLLEHWMSLRKKDGTASEYYDHWVLGKTTEERPPRWCVIRDVLHWVE
ncbi:MAG: cation:dicarboxylase symporter family transporter [Planctomycetota bacterium]